VNFFEISVFIGLLLYMVQSEAPFSFEGLSYARNNGYFGVPSEQPDYKVATLVSGIASSDNDRIWVFGGSANEICTFSNRFPALSLTNTVRLQYEIQENDYAIWENQFLNGMPKVVIS